MKLYSSITMLFALPLLFLLAPGQKNPSIAPAATPPTETNSPTAAKIEWLSWEEAVKRSETQPRKFLIDVYTDWCGWCKKMDKTTFVDPAVVEQVSGNFYAVKFDAEMRETLTYNGHTFTFDPSAGRRGSHQLAVALLDGRMSYPSIVYLDENRDRITISPGFKTADTYVNELAYIEGNHYRNETYQEFIARR